MEFQSLKPKKQRQKMLKFYELPYSFDALSPYISEETMDVHFNSHYKGYYAKTLEEMERLEIDADLVEMIDQNLYEKSDKLKDNFGGFYNHSIFWYMLRPKGDKNSVPVRNSLRLIKRDFGSYDNFKKEFLKEAKSRFGSGWTWWVLDPKTGKTEIMTTPNQDFPEMDEYGRKVPLLGVDVWEHAYYLDYKNGRADYVENVLNDAINWAYIEDRVSTALTLT
jgi:Fe-Mn family superoxide dismutase